MLRTSILSLLFSLLCGSLMAQGLKLYGVVSTDPGSQANSLNLVQIDPFTADTTYLYDIPNVFGVGLGSSTYDHDKRRYIFWGRDNAGADRFYAASVDTASFSDPVIQGRPPIELQYDLQDDVTYGLIWDPATSTEYLAKVDLQTGQVFDSLALPGVQAVSLSSSGFNSNTHQYVFVGIDTSGTKRLYRVDALSGQILSQPILTQEEFYRALQFDLTKNTLYGLLTQYDSTLSQTTAGFTQYMSELYLVTVDTLTGQYTMVDSTPVLSGFQAAIQVGSIDFDQLSQTFVMVARDDTSDFRLMLIDANTAQVYSNPLFTTSVFELECDNQIFARQAYQTGTTSVQELGGSRLQAYPNPSTGRVQLMLPQLEGPSEVQVWNATGQQVDRQVITAQQPRLDLSALPSGLYWLRVQMQTGEVAATQLLLTD